MINRKFQNEFNISFEPFMQKKECMVNATEMGSVFDKKAAHYLRMDSIQIYLVVLEAKYGNKIYSKKCFQVAISQLEPSILQKISDLNLDLKFAKIEEEDCVKISENIIEVVHGGRKNGTWMHRQLAIDFASWLDPFLKMWINETIEEILFGLAKIQDSCLRKMISLRDERDTITIKSEKTAEDYKRFFDIDREIDEVDSTKRKTINEKVRQLRLDLFGSKQDTTEE